MFDLKDDKVLEIQPIYKDAYYEQICDTCPGSWSGPEIELIIKFENRNDYKYFRSNLMNNQSNKSISIIIDYLFTNLSDFQNQTSKEFLKNLVEYLDSNYGINIFEYAEDEFD